MLLERNWNQGGAAIPPRGAQRPSLRDILNPLSGFTVAEAKALPADEYIDGARMVTVDGKRWKYSASSALVSDGDQLVIVPTGAATGRWLVEAGGQAVDLALPIGFATADAAVLWTCPVGATFLIEDFAWEVTVSFTGGTTPAIGVSSSNKATPTNWTTKGDLLGGAAGELTAALVASAAVFGGTIGTDMDTVVKRRGAIWKAGDTLRFDRIADAFAAGAGFVHVYGRVIYNNGA
jgi:hypothetical protein